MTTAPARSMGTCRGPPRRSRRRPRRRRRGRPRSRAALAAAKVGLLAMFGPGSCLASHCLICTTLTESYRSQVHSEETWHPGLLTSCPARLQGVTKMSLPVLLMSRHCKQSAHRYLCYAVASSKGPSQDELETVAGIWQCAHCTLANTLSRADCSACGNARGSRP